MIKTQALYDLYNEASKREIQNKLFLIDEQKKKVNEYLPKLQEVSSILSLYIDYHKALNGQIRELPSEILEQGTRQIIYSNTILKTYFDLNKPIIIMSEEIKKLNKQKLEYSIFRHILKTHNEKIANFIFDTGKSYEHSIFGTLKIVHKETVTQKIDWGKSNRNKQTLLDKGLIPYKKEEAELAEKNGETYTGIKWLVPGYKDGMLLVKWTNSPIIKEYLGSDMKFIKYFPARGSYGIVNLLSGYYTRGENVDFNKYEKL